MKDSISRDGDRTGQRPRNVQDEGVFCIHHTDLALDVLGEYAVLRYGGPNGGRPVKLSRALRVAADVSRRRKPIEALPRRVTPPGRRDTFRVRPGSNPVSGLSAVVLALPLTTPSCPAATRNASTPAAAAASLSSASPLVLWGAGALLASVVTSQEGEVLG